MSIFKATGRSIAVSGILFPPSTWCSYLPLRGIKIILTALFAGLVVTCMPAVAATPAITLGSDTNIATGGYYQLRWEAENKTKEFILYESANPDFSDYRTLYRGSDLATVISGKPDNTYFYRVVESGNPDNMSNTAMVTVKHHPLSVAFSFFAVGAVVFIATLCLILFGKRQQQ